MPRCGCDPQSMRRSSLRSPWNSCPVWSGVHRNLHLHNQCVRAPINAERQSIIRCVKRLKMKHVQVAPNVRKSSMPKKAQLMVRRCWPV